MSTEKSCAKKTKLPWPRAAEGHAWDVAVPDADTLPLPFDPPLPLPPAQTLR